MSAGEESLEFQESRGFRGEFEWTDPRDSFAVRSGQMSAHEVMQYRSDTEES